MSRTVDRTTPQKSTVVQAVMLRQCGAGQCASESWNVTTPESRQKNREDCGADRRSSISGTSGG